jgi:hypothetical protein
MIDNVKSTESLQEIFPGIVVHATEPVVITNPISGQKVTVTAAQQNLYYYSEMCCEADDVEALFAVTMWMWCAENKPFWDACLYMRCNSRNMPQPYSPHRPSRTEDAVMYALRQSLIADPHLVDDWKSVDLSQISHLIRITIYR